MVLCWKQKENIFQVNINNNNNNNNKIRLMYCEKKAVATVSGSHFFFSFLVHFVDHIVDIHNRLIYSMKSEILLNQWLIFMFIHIHHYYFRRPSSCKEVDICRRKKKINIPTELVFCGIVCKCVDALSRKLLIKWMFFLSYLGIAKSFRLKCQPIFGSI